MAFYYWSSLKNFNYWVSGSGKTNVLLNINDKILIRFIYTQISIRIKVSIAYRENIGNEILKNSNGFIDYSETLDDVYESLELYNWTKKRRVLIVFDDMTADMESNKKLSPIITELFLRRRKLNISLVFISQSYFKVIEL